MLLQALATVAADKTCHLDASGGIYVTSCRAGPSFAYEESWIFYEGDEFAVKCITNNGEAIHKTNK